MSRKITAPAPSALELALTDYRAAIDAADKAGERVTRTGDLYRLTLAESFADGADALSSAQWKKFRDAYRAEFESASNWGSHAVESSRCATVVKVLGLALTRAWVEGQVANPERVAAEQAAEQAGQAYEAAVTAKRGAARLKAAWLKATEAALAVEPHLPRKSIQTLAKELKSADKGVNVGPGSQTNSADKGATEDTTPTRMDKNARRVAAGIGAELERLISMVAAGDTIAPKTITDLGKAFASLTKENKSALIRKAKADADAAINA